MRLLAVAVVTCGLSACAEPGEFPPFPTAQRRIFRLAKTAESGGGSARLALCSDQPCTVERWLPVDPVDPPLTRDPVPDTVTLVRSGRRMVPQELAGPWIARWRRLSGVADLCVGDPLALPPAGDPAGWRSLVFDPEVSPVRGPEDPRWRWEIHLSGANRCALEGTLRLEATADHADARGLSCGGLAWTEGGSECARKHLQQALALDASTTWETLSREDQEAILAILSLDPEAAELTAELRARLSE